MSIPEKAIYAILANDAGIANCGVGGRIFSKWMRANKPRPAIIYRRVGIDHKEHLGGSAGLAFARMAIDYLADDPLDAYELAEAGRQALQGKRGTFGGVAVRCLRLDGDDDDFETISEAEDAQAVEIVTHEYDMGYWETVPP